LVVLVILLSTMVEAVPTGFTTFFSGPSCPKGWSELEIARGRLVLSVADGSEAGVTVNQPLGPQEDRVHEHVYSTSIDIPSKSVAAIDCCNDQGAGNGNFPINGDVSNSTSGLPFVQMILCTINGNNTDSTPFGTVTFF